MRRVLLPLLLFPISLFGQISITDVSSVDNNIVPYDSSYVFPSSLYFSELKGLVGNHILFLNKSSHVFESKRDNEKGERLWNDNLINKNLKIIKAFKKELKTCLVLYNESLDTLIYEYSVFDDIIIIEGYERLQNKLKGRAYYPTETGAFFSSDGQRIEITKSDSLFLYGVEIGKKISNFIFLFNFQLNDKVFKMGLKTSDRFFDDMDNLDHKLEFESLDTQGKELDKLRLRTDAESFSFGEVQFKPVYPGCEEYESEEERFNCFNIKIRQFIGEEFKFPKKAKKMGIQGKVWVSFIIEKDGSISNVNIERSVDDLLDNEAKRIVRLLPRMNPAKIGNRAVRLRYSLPINAKLQ